MDIIKRLESLTINDGDVLVVEISEEMTPDQYAPILNQIAEHVGRGVLIILTLPGLTVSKLTETEMREYGWVRAPRQEPANG